MKENQSWCKNSSDPPTSQIENHEEEFLLFVSETIHANQGFKDNEIG